MISKFTNICTGASYPCSIVSEVLCSDDIIYSDSFDEDDLPFFRINIDGIGHVSALRDEISKQEWSIDMALEACSADLGL